MNRIHIAYHFTRPQAGRVRSKSISFTESKKSDEKKEVELADCKLVYDIYDISRILPYKPPYEVAEEKALQSTKQKPGGPEKKVKSKK